MPASMPASLPNDLITYDEAAGILGGTNQRVRHLVAYKRLHSYKVPGYKHKFLSRAEVEQVRRGAYVSTGAPAREAEQPGQAPIIPAALGGIVDKVNAFFQHSIDQNTATVKAGTEQNAAIVNSYTVTLSTLAELAKQAPSNPEAKEVIQRFFNEPEVTPESLGELAEGMPALMRATFPKLPQSSALDSGLREFAGQLLPMMYELAQRDPTFFERLARQMQEEQAREPTREKVSAA